MRSTAIPPLFVSHGSPMMALEPLAAGDFLRRLGPALDVTFGRPRAILAVSAHTLTRRPTLLAAARHATVHDFYGFPQDLYRLRHDSPGAPELARRVASLLLEAAVDVFESDQGGIDHGIWSPLRFAYPAADIPVLPLGFPPDWTPARLFELGQVLAPLAAEGVLVMGSGSITHNLQLVFGGGLPQASRKEIAPSAEFRRWFESRAAAADWAALTDYRARAPHAVLMHPTDEHLLPFFVAAGAAGARPAGRRLHDSVVHGCLGMDTYAFGDQADRLATALGVEAIVAVE